jgi:hypothetical protein
VPVEQRVPERHPPRKPLIANEFVERRIKVEGIAIGEDGVGPQGVKKEHREHGAQTDRKTPRSGKHFSQTVSLDLGNRGSA